MGKELGKYIVENNDKEINSSKNNGLDCVTPGYWLLIKAAKIPEKKSVD